VSQDGKKSKLPKTQSLKKAQQFLAMSALLSSASQTPDKQDDPNAQDLSIYKKDLFSKGDELTILEQKPLPNNIRTEKNIFKNQNYYKKPENQQNYFLKNKRHSEEISELIEDRAINHHGLANQIYLRDESDMIRQAQMLGGAAIHAYEVHVAVETYKNNVQHLKDPKTNKQLEFSGAIGGANIVHLDRESRYLAEAQIKTRLAEITCLEYAKLPTELQEAVCEGINLVNYFASVDGAINLSNNIPDYNIRNKEKSNEPLKFYYPKKDFDKDNT